MADKTDSLYGMIIEIVRQETLYLRHYIGKVLSSVDELNIGMVQVSVPELGWDTAEEAPWCYPRQRHSMTVPEVGEWVEVYFLNGDRNRPVYMLGCAEMKTDDNKNCIPEWYKGDPKVRVIYQSPLSKKGIKLDDTLKLMTMDAEKLEFSPGSVEPLVLGNKIKAWSLLVDQALGILFTWAGTGVAPGPTGGIAPLATLNPDTGFTDDILSTTIKGK